MATKLKKYDWDNSSNMTKGEKAVYPWDEWLDGSIWRLTHGKDFQPHPLMMERIIRTRATGRGARVQLRHEPLRGGTEPFGHIVLQRTDITSNGSTAKRATTKKAATKRATKATRRVSKRPAAKAQA